MKARNYLDVVGLVFRCDVAVADKEVLSGQRLSMKEQEMFTIITAAQFGLKFPLSSSSFAYSRQSIYHLRGGEGG